MSLLDRRATAPLRVLVASGNPVKLRATRDGFRALTRAREVSVDGLAVPSGVAHQPLSDEETLRGAVQRVEALKAQAPDADFWVGLEGGVEPHGEELWAFAWAVVAGRGAAGRTGRARTAAFALPDEIARLVRTGFELGEADDRVFGRVGSKREDGAVGLLTDGAIDRAALYAPAVTLALLPFFNPTLYPEPGEGA
jgi:inosine/xanthosine triphosphatase